MSTDNLKNLLLEFLKRIFLDENFTTEYLKPYIGLGGYTSDNAYNEAKTANFPELYKIDYDLEVSLSIQKKYKIDSLFLFDTLLTSFCRKVLYEVKVDNIDKDKKEVSLKLLDKEVDKFISYLDNLPEEINYFVFPINLEVESNLDEKISKQFQIVHSKESFLNLFHKDASLRFQLTIKNRSKKTFVALCYIYELILCLYNLGNIHLQEVNNDFNDYLDYFKAELGDKPNPLLGNLESLSFFSPSILFCGNFKYKIGSDNFEDFKKFTNSFGPLIIKLETENFIMIALNFYKTALEKKFAVEQITYATIALEALYNTDTNEIKKTLIFRCSKILSNYYDAETIEKIKNNISDAYKCRSHYVHGNSKHKKAEDDLARNMLNYARLSIIIFLQLNTIVKPKSKKKTSKECINELIDRALTHKDFDEELSKKLLECFLFNFEEII